jgi:hypothetical protein
MLMDISAGTHEAKVNLNINILLREILNSQLAAVGLETTAVPLFRGLSGSSV